MSIRVFAVGISNYEHLESVDYCEEDAKVFAEKARDYLFATNPTSFTKSEVTMTSLPRKFKLFCDDLHENDTLIFFYAGHGCNYSKVPYLSVIESEDDKDAIVDTWVSLDRLREIAARSKAKKIIFFIDACQVSSGDERSSLFDEFEVREAAKIEDENAYEIIFFSCSKGEKSLSNSDLKHGVWSHFLIEAISCTQNGKKALNEKYELTASGLQKYLYLSVREYYQNKNRSFKQKPRVKIESGFDPILAVFAPEIVDKYVAVPEKHLASIVYQTIEIKDVDDLPGFVKKPFHLKNHVPTKYNPTTSGFAKKVGNKLLVEIIEHAKDKLIELFDLLPDEEIENGGFDYGAPAEDGYGYFDCQYLQFKVALDLDRKNPSKAIIECTLIPLDQSKIYEVKDELDSCFIDWFDKMVFTGKKFSAVELYKKLKKNEKAQALPFTMKYFDQNKSFEIILKSARRITFSDDTIEINFKGTEPLNELLESLTEVSNTMLQIDNSTKLLE